MKTWRQQLMIFHLITFGRRCCSHCLCRVAISNIVASPHRINETCSVSWQTQCVGTVDVIHRLRTNEIWYRKTHKDKIEWRALFFVGRHDIHRHIYWQTCVVCYHILVVRSVVFCFLFFIPGQRTMQANNISLAVRTKPPEIAIIFVLLTALELFLLAMSRFVGFGSFLLWLGFVL